MARRSVLASAAVGVGLGATGVLAALIANWTAIGTWEQFDLITD
jgi:hypothetical protein